MLPKLPITLPEKKKEKITENQGGSQEPPKIMPKKRAPLRFFPFSSELVVEDRVFKGGLIIHLNDQG